MSNPTDNAIPVAPNPRRLPTVELTDSAAMFAGKNILLGDGHHLDADSVAAVPCGAACPHRLVSISCPFFQAPCLVGCTVKQVIAGEGQQYEEQDFFVVAQVGHDLIGEEVVIDMKNPRAVRLRVVNDKRGRPVYADDGLTGSLADDMAWKFLEDQHGQADRRDNTIAHYAGGQRPGPGPAPRAGGDREDLPQPAAVGASDAPGAAPAGQP